jgi:hypothetical protein
MPEINYKLTKDDVEFLAALRNQLDWFANNESNGMGLRSAVENLGSLLNRATGLALFDEPDPEDS